MYGVSLLTEDISWKYKNAPKVLTKQFLIMERQKKKGSTQLFSAAHLWELVVHVHPGTEAHNSRQWLGVGDGSQHGQCSALRYSSCTGV